MKSNIVCIDPGVSGGIAWTNDHGDVFCAPNPYPTSTKGYKNVELKKYQLKGIQDLLWGIRNRNLNSFDYYLEQVASMSCDTPKTAASLNFNHGLWAGSCNSDNLRFVHPTKWQNQLGISLPHGRFNYEARKKALQAFAQEKWGEVEQITWKPDRSYKSKTQPITQKTADAMCMLWVYSEKDL